MAKQKDTLTTRLLSSLRGALMFTVVVAGTTYYLQNSLIVYKKYGSYTHWTIVLMAVPLLAGLLMRLARTHYPLLSSLVGAAASAALLYPQYKTFWAVPPTSTHLAVYIVIVLGFGFIATQPLRTTFMIAFRLGRFAMPAFVVSGTNSSSRQSARSASLRATTSQKPSQKASLSKTQRLAASGNGNMIALLELMVGVTSLVLSVVSIFFLGRG